MRRLAICSTMRRWYGFAPAFTKTRVLPYAPGRDGAERAGGGGRAGGAGVLDVDVRAVAGRSTAPRAGVERGHGPVLRGRRLPVGGRRQRLDPPRLPRLLPLRGHRQRPRAGPGHDLPPRRSAPGG